MSAAARDVPADATRDDASLVAAFEDGSLPETELRHREHVRVAWIYLASAARFEEAAYRFCTNLRRYAEARGKAGLYHETITWAFLALVNQRRHEGRATDFETFAAENADLFEPGLGALARSYDRETLGSEGAKRWFVLPGAGERTRP